MVRVNQSPARNNHFFARVDPNHTPVAAPTVIGGGNRSDKVAALDESVRQFSFNGHGRFP